MAMKKILIILAFIVAGLSVNAAPTAADVLQKSASALLKSGGVTASYTYKSGAYTESGTLYTKEKKYSLISSKRSIWYNGRSLWSLNPSEKEVTLSLPTSAEAAALNPYMLVSSYKTEYTAKLVTSTIKGTYSISLTPKNKNSYIKSATICIRSSNYMPVRLDITDRSGNKSTIIISDVKTGQKLTDSTFTYNAKSHPGVTLIDLR